MNTLEIINRVPATKTEQKSMAEQFINLVADGEVSPIEAVTKMKSIAETISIFLKDERVKDAVLAECEKYGRGESPEYRGAVVQMKEAGVKYDFKVCGDPVYDEIYACEQGLIEKRKEREKFLRTLTQPKTEIDEETGEIYKLNPPVRESTTTFSVTFKNK